MRGEEAVSEVWRHSEMSSFVCVHGDSCYPRDQHGVEEIRGDQRSRGLTESRRKAVTRTYGDRLDPRAQQGPLPLLVLPPQSGLGHGQRTAG